MSNMVRMISENGGIVVCAVDSTEIVRQMESIHRTSAPVSAALGRLLTAASLMGSWLKHEEDTLTLRVDGGGPAGILVAVSDGLGNVRGYAGNGLADAPLREDGKLNVGGVVGKNGTLSVIKDIGLKEPYIGQIPLVSGEIAEDITSYYASSEQTPSVCSLGVLVNKDLSIRNSGGYVLQLMPGADDAEIAKIEENLNKMQPITEMLEKGMSPYDICGKLLDGFSPKLLDERSVEYRCHCSREKTSDILASLGRKELEEMLREEPEAQVECHFCGEKYRFDLSAFLKELPANIG